MNDTIIATKGRSGNLHSNMEPPFSAARRKFMFFNWKHSPLFSVTQV